VFNWKPKKEECPLRQNSFRDIYYVKDINYLNHLDLSVLLEDGDQISSNLSSSLHSSEDREEDYKIEKASSYYEINRFKNSLTINPLIPSKVNNVDLYLDSEMSETEERKKSNR
jgi:hypothetical protein